MDKLLQRRVAERATTARPRPIRALVGCAALIECWLLVLVAVAPVAGVSQSISPLARTWPWLLGLARVVFGDQLVDDSVPPGCGWPALALYVVALLGASGAAALALAVARRHTQSDRRLLALVLVGALVLGTTLVLLPALPSDDLFSYILYGRISALHHANPLLQAPSAFPGDPFLALVFWRGVLSVYGPAWLLLSGGLTLLAEAFGGALATYVLLFKLLGLAAHLANSALIWAILTRLAPTRRLSGTLLYAWNPLCLLEFCASAHNDAVMLTWALLGVYCLVRAADGGRVVRRRAGAGQQLLPPALLWEAAALVSFGLSISTKYVLLALLPLYLALVLRQQRARSAATGAKLAGAKLAGALAWRVGIVCAVVALTALPFWAGPRTLGALLASPPAQQLDNSPLEALSWPLRALAEAVGLPRATAAGVVGSALKLAGLLGFAVIWLAQLRRVRDLATLLVGWGWVLLGYVLCASGWFWPWYVTWAVAVIALLPWSRLTVATLLLAAGVLTLYGFLPLYAAPLYGFRALVAFGPALSYLAWHWSWAPVARIRSAVEHALAHAGA